MLELSLQNLAKLLGARYQGKSNVFPKGVALDSRKVKEGDLFFALKGEKVNGHLFIDEAIKKGAVGAVITDLGIVHEPEDKNLVICKDPIILLQDLAKLTRQNINIPVVGITGSTGKTTTKDLTFSILKQKFNTMKTEGNYNNELGLPLTICHLNKEHEAVVLEMGMRGLGQIDFLCKIAQPTHGIITNIGHVHAELLGSIENIAQAKAELLNYIPDEGSVLLNIADKELLTPWIKKCQGNIIWFGLDSKADLWAKDIQNLGEEGSIFKVCFFDDECVEVKINIPGKHNILNALAAIGIAKSLDIGWDDIRKGLENINLTSMRLQIENTSEGVKVINDTYNANPTSMKAALNVLSQLKGKRKIAVLGDMYELGKYEEQGHKVIGKVAWENGVDNLLVVGKLGRLIGLGAIEAGMKEKNVFFFQNNDEVIEFLKEFMDKEDVILIKGSRGMKMETIVRGIMGE